MDKNTLFRKSLVLGIILLFVGASVVPSISGNVKSMGVENVNDVDPYVVSASDTAMKVEDSATQVFPQVTSLSPEHIKSGVINQSQMNLNPKSNDKTTRSQSPPNFQWAYAYGGSADEFGSSTQQTNDGGYIIFGRTASFGAGGSDFLLIKTYPDGQIQWDHCYGGSDDEDANSVQQTSDGGYILVGTTYSFGHGGRDILLLKVDEDGDVDWSYAYGWSGDEEGIGVCQTNDGGFAITGSTDHFADNDFDADVLLIKTDGTGDVEWAWAYGGSSIDYGVSVVQTMDGGFFITGDTLSFGHGNRDVYIIKTDSLGNSQWGWAYGGSEYDSGEQGRQTSDGGYIFVGYTRSFGPGNGDMYLIKTNSDGDSQWGYAIGWSDSVDAGNDVHQDSDGGYITCGTTEHWGNHDVWLLKTDSNGDTDWWKVNGWSDIDVVLSLDLTSDGGYIVGGYTNSWGQGKFDMMLIKYGVNNPPYTPSSPSPWNHATGVSIYADLSWTGGDPDGDTVTYDVYFEAWDSTPDYLVSSGQTSTTYDPGTMSYTTTYYWQIVATDEPGDSTTGPVWDFTTRSGGGPSPPSAPSNLDARYPTTSSIELSWTKGGGDYTMIRRKTGNYPDFPSDGSQAYYGTGSSTTDSGLSSDTTYYYSAWARDSSTGLYSTGYSQDYETTDDINVKPLINFLNINGVTELERHIFVKDSSPLTISGTASDPDGYVKKVKVKLEGGNWEEYNNYPITSWSIDLDISSADDGENTLKMKCMDNKYAWSPTVEKTIYINKMEFNGEDYGEFEPKSDSDYKEKCVGFYLWNPFGDDIWVQLYCNYRKNDYNMWKSYNPGSGITTIHSYAYTEANVLAGAGEQTIQVKVGNMLTSHSSLDVGDGITVDKAGWYNVKWPDYITTGKLRNVLWEFGEPFVGFFLGDAEAKGQYSTLVRVADTSNSQFIPALGPKEKGIGEELGVIGIESAAIGMDESEVLNNIGTVLGLIGDAGDIISLLKYLEYLEAGGSIPVVGEVLDVIGWAIMVWQGIKAETIRDYKTKDANPTRTINNYVWLEPVKTYMPVFQIDPLYSRSKAPAGLFGVALAELFIFKTQIGSVEIEYIGATLPETLTESNSRNNPYILLITVKQLSDAIIVDDDGDGDFTSIQDAIDNASAGDTIEVYSGTYYENIIIDKTINLIGIPLELENGTDSNNPIIKPYPPLLLNRSEYYSAIEITADNCNISGFNITFTKQVGFTAITLDSASNNNITDVNLSKNDIGIQLVNWSSNNKFFRNFLINNTDGIIINDDSSNNTFVNNTVIFSDSGVVIENSSNNIFKENIVTFCSSGTSIVQSINNTFSGNLYFFNLNGLSLRNSSNHNISDNYISASVYNGILLADASYNRICDNIFSYRSGISLIGDSNNLIIQGNIISENISGSDTRASKPVYYYVNEQNVTVPSDAGQVLLVNCTNFTLTGLNLSNTDFGVQLQSSSNITITNCYIANNTHGIQLIDSSNNVISNCTMFNNTISGVEIHSSSEIVVTNATNSSVNISIDHTGSTNNTISNCIISNNTAGVILHSPFNTIIDNTFQNDGISLSAGNNFNLTNSSFPGSNVTIKNNTIDFTMQTIGNNTVDGKPIYYYSNQRDFSIPTDAGQIILVNCSNFTIQDVNISNVEIGIQIVFSNNGTIVENTVTNCTTGIAMRYFSDNNTIYHNHFMNNTINAYDTCTNTWDNGYPSGGNYWDDYGGVDIDDDGIGNIPYNISGDSNKDQYPLGYFPNNVPIANFTYSPSSPTDADVIQFNDISIDVNGSIYLWYWEFGDNNTSIHPNPTHQYADDGTYIVNLTVADEYGISNSTQKTIVVSNTAPIADFLYGPSNPSTVDFVHFHDCSYDPNGNIVNWTWDFDDDSISYEQNPIHRYSNEGSYIVTLTVRDDDSASDLITEQVNVTLPVPDIYVSPNHLEIIYENGGMNSLPPHIHFRNSQEKNRHVSISSLENISKNPSTGCCEYSKSKHRYRLGHTPLPAEIQSRFPSSIFQSLRGTLPSSWDWRNITFHNVSGDWTTNPKDQGLCGSCWDFAAHGTLEAIINIGNTDPTLDFDLSEQYILSCATLDYGCDGYNAYYAYAYMMNNRSGDPEHEEGALIEACFPYEAGDTVPCSDKCENWMSYLIPISDYGYLSSPSRDTIKQMLTDRGPLCLSFDVYDDFYVVSGPSWDEHGVYTYDGTSNLSGSHQIVAVGYNDTPSNPYYDGYWICKNSWGADWGPWHDGFFAIAYGECEIEEELVWVDYESSSYLTVYNDGDITLSVSDISKYYKSGEPTGWLTVIPHTFSVLPSNLTFVNVDANASTLPYGVYHAWIHIYSNDPDENPYNVTINFTVVTPRPIADFTFTPENPKTGDAINFIDNSTDSDGVIVNWTWDFDDGSISYEQNPMHQYSSVGNYTVTLTVTDDDGANDSVSKNITVIDGYPPEIQNQGQDKIIVAHGEEISLYAQGKDNVALDWSWLATNETGAWTVISGKYGSPMKMQENDQWQWSNFTWQNPSIPNGTVVGWKIYYNDTSGNVNYTDVMSFTIREANSPPDDPAQPSGPTLGYICVSYDYSTSTTDPESDNVSYGWDWDGDLVVDDWTGWCESGETCIVAHIWDEPGMYDVRVKAKDTFGNKSGWSDPLMVTMDNHPPNMPSSPDPDDNATDIDINTDISWTGGDPDSCDTVTYDVYFGNVTPPPQVESNWSTTVYNPGTMNYNTTYYWKIIAYDDHNHTTEGPIWEFTTKGEIEFESAIIIGLISNLSSDGDFMRLSGRFIYINASGISFFSGEIIVSKGYLGYVGSRFIIGRFDATVVSDTSSPALHPLCNRIRRFRSSESR